MRFIESTPHRIGVQTRVQRRASAKAFLLCGRAVHHTAAGIGCRSKVQYADLLALLGIALGGFEGTFAADYNFRFFGFVSLRNDNVIGFGYECLCLDLMLDGGHQS